MGVGSFAVSIMADVFEAVAEAESAVVMEVVAEEHVGRRGLLGGGLERGVRVEQRHDRQPTAVGDAQHAHAAVVAGHVLDQPVDGVVGVGAFVDGLADRARSRGGRSITNWPSDLKRPRMSWKAKM